MTSFIARVLGRLPLGAVTVRIAAAASEVDVAALQWSRQLNEEGLRVDGVTAVETGLTWPRGPVDAVILDRQAVPPEAVGAALSAWTMHIPTMGLLVLIGCAPAEIPAVPPLCTWRGPDTRVWVPLLCDGDQVAWQCAGYMGDL